MNKKTLSPEETLDTLFNGGLSIIQRKRGYRFSLDAVLLAYSVSPRGSETVIDLGTGNGVIPLILAYLYPSLRVVGLEIQESMVERALRNVALNRLEERVEICRGDVRSVARIFSPASFDRVVSNPPYRKPRSGRRSPDPEKRIARHEVEGSLRDFVRAGSYLLGYGGKMALVYPAARAMDLLQTMREEGLEPKRMRWVHSFANSPASLILVEGTKGGRSEAEILPPLVVYSGAKEYSEELKAYLFHSPPRGVKEAS